MPCVTCAISKGLRQASMQKMPVLCVLRSLENPREMSKDSQSQWYAFKSMINVHPSSPANVSISQVMEVD